MPKKSESMDERKRNRLWEGVTEDDYSNESNIEDKEMGTYNMEKMSLYALNVSCSRHILDSMDSLKPVERRILYSMYLAKAYDHGAGIKKKSQSIVGEANKFHPHGGTTIYDTLVGMSQYWKRGIPLIHIYGSNGDPTIKKYAADRYTEAAISKYAYECFFETFDPSCVEMTLASNMEDYIPVSLPSKFPNILLNGGLGIAYGYSFTIPPYNPDDVIMATKRLLRNPDDHDFFIYPDLPTGCDIIDDGSELRKICETGVGKLHMRAHIEILEEKNHWVLEITSVPWLTSPVDIREDIAKLQKSGMAQIEDVRDASDQYKLKDGTIITDIILRILVNKALDPYAIREILYKNTSLDRTLSVQFRMVEDGLNIVQRDLYSVLNSWIDGRKEYLRRIYNKKIRYTEARISVLKIFIELKDPKKIDKVIKIIMNHNEEDTIEYLVKEFKMNSYQASQVADAKLKAWNRDKVMSYEQELPLRIQELEGYNKIVRSEKEIDKVILRDLDDLKKYAHPRKSSIILKEDGPEISDTEHILVFTKKGRVKKLPANPIGRSKGYGAFAAGDYPTHRIKISNLNSVILFDRLGRYSIIPVSQIPNSLNTDIGESVYNIAKLQGEIISVYPFISQSTEMEFKKLTKKRACVFSLTKSGLMKKMSITEFTNSRSVKNVRFMKGKADDQLAMAQIVLDGGNFLVYSENGDCSIVSSEDIPEIGKDGAGNFVITLKDGDNCKGFCCVNQRVPEVLVVTERGGMKRVDCTGETFSSAVPMKRRRTTILSKLSAGDTIHSCIPISKNVEKIVAWNRKDIYEFALDDIPVLSRRASPQKLISVPNGDNVISVLIVPKE